MIGMLVDAEVLDGSKYLLPSFYLYFHFLCRLTERSRGLNLGVFYGYGMFYYFRSKLAHEGVQGRYERCMAWGTRMARLLIVVPFFRSFLWSYLLSYLLSFLLSFLFFWSFCFLLVFYFFIVVEYTDVVV